MSTTMAPQRCACALFLIMAACNFAGTSQKTAESVPSAPEPKVAKEASAGGSYLLATASTGGTFYPVGVAIATLIKVRLQPEKRISMSAITSAGSGDNINLIRKGEAQFGILQGLYGAWAQNGEGPFKELGPQTELRSVTMLWHNVEHFVVDSSAVRGNHLTDIVALNGQRFSIGKKNSGTEGSGRYILSALGISPDQFNNVHMGYAASASALQDGRVEGMNTPAGVPVGAVTRAFGALGKKIKILEISDALLAKINAKYPLWSPFRIEANTYPGQTQAIQTISQPNILVVDKDVPDEHVYEIVRAIYENLAFLKGIHAATKAMAIERAVSGLAVPLHPGAIEFYREKNLNLPAELVRDN